MNVRYQGSIAGAALLIGIGCAHTGATGTNQPYAANAAPGPVGSTDNVMREKDMLMSQADGTQPGRIRNFTGDMLTVENANSGAPGPVTLKIDSSVPVFQGSQKVGTDSLMPGQDVRVFFKNAPDNTQPLAIAVVIDTPSATAPAAPHTNRGTNDRNGLGNDSSEPSGQPIAPAQKEPDMDNDMNNGGMNNGGTTSPNDKMNPDDSAGPGTSAPSKDDNSNGTMDNGDHALPNDND